MLSIYPACFFKEKNGYSIIFPDLNWLATSGDDENSAMAMAIDCLAGYLYISQKAKEDIPLPSSLDAVDIKAVAKELQIKPISSFVNMVSVDVEEYAKAHFEKSVKKTLSIPEWLNNAATDAGINFSKTLQDGLMRELHFG